MILLFIHISFESMNCHHSTISNLVPCANVNSINIIMIIIVISKSMMWKAIARVLSFELLLERLEILMKWIFPIIMFQQFFIIKISTNHIQLSISVYWNHSIELIISLYGWFNSNGLKRLFCNRNCWFKAKSTLNIVIHNVKLTSRFYLIKKHMIKFRFYFSINCCWLKP